VSTVTISVVFSDLVGSTELGSRLGPTATEELRTTHFGILRAAIADAGGTEVKNLGDGLMAVFPSLGGALQGAVEMQRGIARHNRRGNEPMAIRVGISNGDATEEDGDYFGEPVVEAARLCAKAEGGQILTTDVVRTLARRSDHEFTAVGELELKGLPQPVAGFAIGWDDAGQESSFPLPNRLAQPYDLAFCGRAGEREALAQLWKQAGEGEHRLALLAGEAGMGKTRLSTEVATAAHAEGATVLYGRCDEEIGLPYQPFVEALEHCVEHADAKVLAAHVERFGGEVGRLAPALRRRLPDAPAPQVSDPETERYLLFGAVTGLLAEVSALDPVVLVLDDLHWADKPTLLLLEHLVKSAIPMSLLAIGTYRDTDLSADHPLVNTLADLRREPAVERIALAGLEDIDLVEMMEHLAGHEMDADGTQLAHALRRETAGNPFFAAELLRHLADTGQIAQDEAGHWVATVDVASMGLPDSVREVVGRRIRRLSAVAYGALSVASVIGRDFDLATLCAVDDADEDAVLDALEEAVEASVIAEVEGIPGRFTFVHALMQHTLHDDLGAARRARTHARVAAVLEAQLGDDPGDRIGELAHHWLAATRPSDTVKAVGYAALAGERALSSLAPHEATRWFAAGLELMPSGVDDGSRARLLAGLGDAQRQSGDPVHRQTLLEAAHLAHQVGDDNVLTRAALANHRGLPSGTGSVDVERVEILELAIQAAGGDDSAARATLLAMLALELTFARDLPRRRALVYEAQDMARRLGDDAVLLRVLNLTLLTLLVPESLDEVAESAAEALALSERVGDPVARFWAAFGQLMVEVYRANRPGIDEALALLDKMTAEIGQPSLKWVCLSQHSWRSMLAGDAAAAEGYAVEALQYGNDTGQPDSFAMFGGHILAVRWMQGRQKETLGTAVGAVAENPGIPAFKASMTQQLAVMGQLEQARTHLQEAIAEDFWVEARDYLWTTTATLFALAASYVGDTVAAARLWELLEPWADQGVTTLATCTGTVNLYLARIAVVLGKDEDAARLFAETDAQQRRLEAPFYIAFNAVAWAGFLRQRAAPGDAERSIELATEAIELSQRLGFGEVERDAQALLAG
jgi:tetratricopeptide (TPR) repeat protein